MHKDVPANNSNFSAIIVKVLVKQYRTISQLSPADNEIRKSFLFPRGFCHAILSKLRQDTSDRKQFFRQQNRN